MTGWLRQLWSARRPRGEAGTTLMELTMGMTVMAIFLSIATTAIVSMFSSTGKIQQLQNTSTQLNTAFVRLDKQVRYAAMIDQPTGSLGAGNLSVAFQSVSGTGTTCTQLRIQPVSGSTQQQLVERSWTVLSNSDGTTSASNVSGWNQLAFGVSATDQGGATVTPFTVSTPLGAAVQQLQLRLIDLDGAANAPTGSASEITFSALNSAAASAAAANGSLTAGCAQSGLS